MTPEEQRIAIAVACGFKRLEKMPDCFWDYKQNRTRLLQDSAMAKKRLQMGMENPTDFLLPDYINDLNAMHLAENTLLTGFDPAKPNETLPEIWQTYSYWMAHLTPLGIQDHATAAQRAEAFLRTIGQWKD